MKAGGPCLYWIQDTLSSSIQGSAICHTLCFPVTAQPGLMVIKPWWLQSFHLMTTQQPQALQGWDVIISTTVSGLPNNCPDSSCKISQMCRGVTIWWVKLWSMRNKRQEGGGINKYISFLSLLRSHVWPMNQLCLLEKLWSVGQYPTMALLSFLFCLISLFPRFHFPGIASLNKGITFNELYF